jgi:AcrR family transcriptional regulator
MSDLEEPASTKRPRTRRVRKSAAVRRQDIIDAAMEIIRHHGTQKLTTRALAQAVGIAQPTLFLHFGNKTQVLIELVDTIQGRLQEGLRGLDLDRLDPLARLRAVIRFQLGFIQRQPGIPRLLFSEELQTGDPAFRARMEALVGFFLQFLTGLLRAARDAGQIRADIEPESHACLLLASIQGLSFRWILSHQRFVLADQADTLADTVIAGWAPRPG